MYTLILVTIWYWNSLYTFIYVRYNVVRSGNIPARFLALEHLCWAKRRMEGGRGGRGVAVGSDERIPQVLTALLSWHTGCLLTGFARVLCHADPLLACFIFMLALSLCVPWRTILAVAPHPTPAPRSAGGNERARKRHGRHHRLAKKRSLTYPISYLFMVAWGYIPLNTKVYHFRQFYSCW